MTGQKAFAAATSAGGSSPVPASEPFLNLNPLGFRKTVFDQTPSQRPLTPLQKRGQALADSLRNKGKERGGMSTISGPRIGIALGGGSARGLTHIPYIEAMDELGLKPAVISGTSIGALIGAGWAAGMTGKELREHSYEVLGTMRKIATKLWAIQLRGLGGILKNGISMQLDASSIVDSFIPEDFPLEFKDLKIPLYVVATDFQSWHQVVFNSGALRPAIAGSIAIPSLFKPVNYANHILVDGGVVNPLPLDQADIGTDFLIGIDVNGDPSEGISKTDHKALDIWFGSAQIMMHSLTAHMMAAYPPDIYIRPHVANFGALEFWRVREIVSHGEAEKERFKRILAQKVEDYIQDRLPAAGVE
ncbi:patatin-like phospholipase family protein [Devosia sp. J2-20]|uniref:Patatin-like phospholipase family protein n=1 Tax=Devosia litorisediminis TaxID=2829817 RepID=A0A942EBX6_9HYPH|nr:MULTISPECIES: patatin-like phospholipase family protein [Devosia]MBS3849387.1 patatin-like phospholipase family protein [Devosia litorisediminis]MCZ4344611.1 patatin-like phospholipase family protein [Devosia neptuniae]WDQ97561.1 patatin-like phospholipase family protein [Devosia sp. J2-20]